MICYKHFLFIGLWLCCANIVFAQKNFVEATLVTAQKDTLKGYLNYQNWDSPIRYLEFKPSIDGTVQKMKHQDVMMFKAENKQYLSAIVDVNKSPTDIKKLTHSRLPKWDKDTVFLKVLLEGVASLYYYRDENDKMHYFYRLADNKTHNDSIRELVVTEYLIQPRGTKAYTHTDKQYQQQLLNELRNEKRLK